ncbi:MAG: protein translocase subunit SecF [Acidimicrobiales bacterium]
MSAVTEGTHRRLTSRLYHGETAFDFVGNRKQWFALSGLIILVGLTALGVKGLNFGIDFKGGTNWQVPANGVSVTAARSAVGAVGVRDANVQTLRDAKGKTVIRVQAKTNPADVTKVTDALAKVAKASPNDVSVNSVGPTWGHDISQKAIRALVAFFIAVFIFIALRFQWKMALAAIVAVIHDIAVTVGIYSIFGFPVTPATVIAILTILGYSLYDTVVVFDKVDENTKGLAASGRMTYSDTVNLSMNQVLMRSINTSLVAILPIASVLVVGDLFLGATTLKEFGLALFVGLLTGAYSSIFIAAPILAILKEREPRYATIRQRLQSRGGTGALLTPRAAAEASAGGSRRQVVEDDEALDDEMATAGPVIRPGQGRAAPPRPTRAGPAPNRPRAAPRGRKKGGRRR